MKAEEYYKKRVKDHYKNGGYALNDTCAKRHYLIWMEEYAQSQLEESKEQLEKEREFKGKLLKHCIDWRNFLKGGDPCDNTASQVYQEIRVMIVDDYETQNQSKDES